MSKPLGRKGLKTPSSMVKLHQLLVSERVEAHWNVTVSLVEFYYS